jgi:hypothetical protein
MSSWFSPTPKKRDPRASPKTNKDFVDLYGGFFSVMAHPSKRGHFPYFHKRFKEHAEERKAATGQDWWGAPGGHSIVNLYQKFLDEWTNLSAEEQQRIVADYENEWSAKTKRSAPAGKTVRRKGRKAWRGGRGRGRTQRRVGKTKRGRRKTRGGSSW